MENIISDLAKNKLKGIIPVVQIPFDEYLKIDWKSLENLINYTLENEVSGMLIPAFASERESLSKKEVTDLVSFTCKIVGSNLPVIGCATDSTLEKCIFNANSFFDNGVNLNLISAPIKLRNTKNKNNDDAVFEYFDYFSKNIKTDFVIQDISFIDNGMEINLLEKLYNNIPNLVGYKIETKNANKKYTIIKDLVDKNCFLAGGWSVTQLIEGLDRGIDAIIPECSMVKIYNRILKTYNSGNRDLALKKFQELIPILNFSNQDIYLSISFFKKLLKIKKIIKTDKCRQDFWEWDKYNSKIAEELIDYYLQLEKNQNDEIL